ncbi:MAG: glutamyl-tRNA reductase [Candidatus Omnitrophica bacterium]|nr:glutamyl-tRNA reductase [Candidatus Omnitrophota bacterium]
MLVIGLNHKTTPIEIREKFYLNALEADLLLSELKNNPVVSEAFVLSTCNRIEVYIKCGDARGDGVFVIDLIAKIKKTVFDFDYSKYIYTYQGSVAIEHLLRVAAGLDSLVVGEKQILGQVKAAVERARDLGAISRYFNILTNVAIRAGKKAQHETQISFGGSSISWAAIEMAEQIAGSLEHKSVLVIGAGKMGELALGNLCAKGLKKIYLMNRTGEKAEALAQRFGGVAASFWDIKELLAEVDLCFCSAGAPHYILDEEKVSQIMPLRRDRPLVFVDISMPRNIAPNVGSLPGVYLRSIDDLDQVVNANMKKRQAAVAQVEGIIRQKLMEFNGKIQKLNAHSGSDFFEAAETV